MTSVRGAEGNGSWLLSQSREGRPYRVSARESCGESIFEDPYRCLEDESPGVLGWQRTMDREARVGLGRIPGRERLERAVAEHLAVSDLRAPKPGGELWFWLDHRGDPGGALYVSEKLDGLPRRVLAPADLASQEPSTLDWYAPSPDGTLVALGVSSCGDEQSVLHLLHVGSGSTVGRPLPHASGGQVAWLPDSSGLYCCAGRARDTESPTKFVWFLRPGEPAERVDVPGSLEGLPQPSIQASRDGRYLGVSLHTWAPRLRWVLDLFTDEWLQGPTQDAPGSFHGFFEGDSYYAVTSEDAPRGRVVASPVRRLAEPRARREIIGEGPAVIRSITATDDGMVVCEYLDGISRLRIVSREGYELGSVPLPDAAVVRQTTVDPNQIGADAPVEACGTGVTFTFSTVTTSPVLCHYDVGSGRLSRLTEAVRTIPELEWRGGSCTSSDGGRVRYDVVKHADCQSDGSGPTLIVAYGGWNHMWLPRGYLGMFAPWVTAGGTFVFAHLRGDGSDGALQASAGRRERKQQTFDDLYAVAEQLITDGVTTSSQLGLCGLSNGGLLVGVAITQRPELFRAVVALVPLFDMCRFVRERFAEFYVCEYGDPRIIEEATWLRRYSPYHNVTTGVSYPAMLMVCGERDIRTHPWHARKMLAALRAANAGPRPVLLRVHRNCGHFTAANHASAAHISEWLAFLMHEVGLDPRDAS